MAWDWETFPQYMDRIDALPKGINISHFLPLGPAVAYALGSFAEAKERLPNEKETQQIVRLMHEPWMLVRTAGRLSSWCPAARPLFNVTLTARR